MGDTIGTVTTWRQRYNAYMQTPQWAAISRRVTARDGKFLRCGENAHLEAHHLTYDRLTHEDLRDLVTLCHACHQVFHRHRRRNPANVRAQVSMAEATVAFIRDIGNEPYSTVVMADHTPPVGPAPERTDGKRVVSMDRRARGKRGGDPAKMSGRALRARAERYRQLRDRGF